MTADRHSTAAEYPRGGKGDPSARVVMREVAARAGVAMSSVSRVLSGHPDVSPKMRARVLTAVKELDYQPDMLARGLRRRETMTVGFVVGDISNPLVSQFVKGAELTLRQTGYSMLLTNSLFDVELDRRNVELLSRRRVDGLLLLPVSETHQPTIRALEQLDIPMVTLERNLPPSVGASSVFSDHNAGMQPAVEHLLDLGHRRVALLTGQQVRPTLERSAALQACFRRRGLEPTFEVFAGRYSYGHGEQVTGELLDRARPPTALIAASNQITHGALSAISKRGIAVGSDLSFIGCDDLTLARFYDPPLAMLARDPVALGRSAADLLVSHLRDGSQQPSVVIHPTSFIRGPSCGPV